VDLGHLPASLPGLPYIPQLFFNHSTSPAMLIISLLLLHILTYALAMPTVSFPSVPPVSDSYDDAQLIKSRDLDVGTNDTGSSALEARQWLAAGMTIAVAAIIITDIVLIVQVFDKDDRVSRNLMFFALFVFTDSA
jgi:hypothetical protein